MWLMPGLSSLARVFPDSLLQYQFVALMIWLVAVEFWTLQALGFLCFGCWSDNSIFSNCGVLRIEPSENNVLDDDSGSILESPGTSSVGGITSMFLWPRVLTRAGFSGAVRSSIVTALLQMILVLMRSSQTTVRRKGKYFSVATFLGF